MFSVICLPCMNAFWYGVIRLSMRGLSLLTRTLEIILYVTLHRLIGLNCVTDSGVGILGIKVMKVWFNDLSKKTWVEESSDHIEDVCLHCVPVLLVKICRNPSGPGVFRGPIWFTAWRVSSSWIGRSNWWSWFGVRVGIGICWSWVWISSIERSCESEKNSCNSQQSVVQFLVDLRSKHRLSS